MRPENLAMSFFEDEARKVLERTMPGTLSQICVGFFRSESELFLKDKNFESEFVPAIQLILFEQNNDLATKIDNALTVGLPEIFGDFRVVRTAGEHSKKSFEVWYWQDLLENLISLRRRPTDPVGYAKVSESQFFALLNGKIFWDPGLELSRAQGQWDHMPQEVWYWRHHWTWANIVPHKEMIQRIEDDNTGMSKLSAFKRVEWTARLAFLTARKYAPPQPMLLDVLRGISDYGGIAERLSWCLNTLDSIETVRLCDEVISELRGRLVTRQIIPDDLGKTDDKAVCDTLRISDHFLKLIPSNFRSQAARVCPIDLLGSLAQSVKFAP
jgi:hypothetical protein